MPKHAPTPTAQAISIDDDACGSGIRRKRHKLAKTDTPDKTPSITPSAFDALPDSAYIREAGLVQCSKRPSSTAPLPFSAPTLWRKVKAGEFPAPRKISARVTCWNVGQVRQWMREQGATAHTGGNPVKRKQSATATA
jgi:prophage regulatory protein